MGPQPIAGSYTTSSGRVTSLAVDPTTPATVYAGTAGGGVWKSTNSGAAWSPLTDNQATLAIGAVAVDPNDHLTVYAGTGEPNGSIDSQRGAGVLKSTDGGATWTLYGAGQFAGHYIYSIAVDRTDRSRVLVASSVGLYTSTDGGQTFARNNSLFALSPNTANYLPRVDALIQDPDPAHGGNWYAAVDERCQAGGFIGASTDGGNTWTQTIRASSLAGFPNIARFGMAEGPGGVMYAALAACKDTTLNYADGQLVAVLKSTDFGSTWAVNKSMPDPFSVNGEVQGWYDITVGVDPTNANRAVFGGVTMVATTDGGTTFTDIAKPYAGGPIHADFHAITFTGANSLYAGNDGGVWSTADLGGTGAASDWTNLNATLGITTFYAGTALDTTHMLGGSQDNGTSGLVPGGPTPPAWNLLAGGDGGDTTMVSGSTTFYGEQSYGAMFRADYTKPNNLTPAGPCSSSNTDPACPETSGFVTPFVVDPANASIIFTAGTHLYRSTTGGVPAGSGGWQQISGDLTSGTTLLPDGDYVSAMAITPDGSVLALGTAGGKLWFVANPTASPSYIDVSAQIPAYDANHDTGSPWVTSVSLPSCKGLPCGASVSLGAVGIGRIWQVSSQGGNPNNITNNLDTLIPNTVVNSVLETNDGSIAGLYVGTDSGVFACFLCSNGTQSWLRIGSGLPNAKVDQVSLTADGNDLVAWTHGRGAWMLPRTAAQSVSSTAIAFGSVTVRETSPSEFVTVTNSGLLTTQINSMTMSGPDAADFAQTDVWNCTFSQLVSGPLPIQMWPGSTCEINATYTPSVSGPESATLSVNSSNVPPLGINLTGTGIAPTVSLNTTNLAFPTTTVANASPGVMTVTNKGPGNLDLTKIQISGGNAGDFTYLNDACTGAKVVPGTSCKFDVQFQPAGAGSRSATLSIYDNAANSPQMVALSGSAVLVSASVNVTSLDFGFQNIGTSSPVQNVIVTNTGPGDLISSGFLNYGLAIGGANPGDFTATIGSCANPVPPAVSCTITVGFAPQAGTTATRSATLTITDNSSASPMQVAVRGSAGSPVASVSPSSVSFADQNAGTSSPAQLITITNAGSGSLTIAGAYSVNPSPPFSIVPGGTCASAPLSAGSSCTVAVQFSPPATGSYNGTFNLVGPSGANTAVTLTGTGIAPGIQAPSTVQFGSVVWSQPATQVATIKNTGSADLVLGTLSVTGSNQPDFAIVAAQDTCSGRTIPPGGTCSVGVVFTPGNITYPATMEQASLRIPDNVAGQAVTNVALSGSGVAAALTMNPPTAAFPSMPVGSSSTMTLTVSNAVSGTPGTSALAVSGFSVSGADPGDFTVRSDTCAGVQLAPGATCTVTVAFAPAAVGARTARLNVAGNFYPSCCTAYADLTGVGSAAGWESLGGLLEAGSGPAIASSGPNTSTVFVRGQDNQLWTRTWNGSTWSGWTSLGGILISDPSAVSQGPNSIDVFVIGTDHGIWHRAWNGTAWSAWDGSAGAGLYATSSPEVTSWGSGRLDLVVRGTDSRLWHRSWSGTSWGPWDAVGGVATSDPGMVASGQGRVDVFVRGTDNALWHRQGDGAGAWGAWASLGGTLTSGPDAVSCSPGHLDVYVVGPDRSLWHRGFNGTSWSSWQKVGGVWTSNPGAVCRPGSTIVDVTERASDGSLWHTMLSGT